MTVIKEGWIWAILENKSKHYKIKMEKNPPSADAPQNQIQALYAFAFIL